MIAYAALDLRGGRVVQLVGGRPDAERISLPGPADVARRWIDAGFAALHVVDLDAAFGTGDNDAAISDILDVAGSVPVQIGGGVRTEDRAAALIERGAARVVVGTRAVEDAPWRTQLTQRFPGRIVVAADVRGDQVVVRGWTAGAGIDVDDLLTSLATLPLAAVLVTDVDREGAMGGVDATRFEQLNRATRHPLIASGGVADDDDLHALRDAGVAGVVLGMALYTGALDTPTLAREFAA